MDIILTKDITGLGYKDDVVSVKPGYGRNYLIPQGYAVIASEGNKKAVNEKIKQIAHKAEKIKTEAEELANAIGNIALEIRTKAGESGKIFGAVTSLQISEALSAKGFEVDRKKISFPAEVKVLGNYTATLNLHKEVKKDVAFSVVAE